MSKSANIILNFHEFVNKVARISINLKTELLIENENCHSSDEAINIIIMNVNRFRNESDGRYNKEIYSKRYNN